MSAAKNPTFYVYNDKSGYLRWRLRAGNGKILADSAESYKSMRSLMHAIEIVTFGSIYAKVVRV